MKKYILIFSAALMLCVSLSSCGSADNETSETKAETEAETTTEIATVQSDPGTLAKRLTLADELLILNEGRKTSFSGGNVNTVGIVSALNDTLANDKVTAFDNTIGKHTVSDIEENGKCAEIIYKKTQKIRLSDNDDISFDRVMYVFEGRYENVIIFISDESIRSFRTENADDNTLMLIDRFRSLLG